MFKGCRNKKAGNPWCGWYDLHCNAFCIKCCKCEWHCRCVPSSIRYCR